MIKSYIQVVNCVTLAAMEKRKEFAELRHSGWTYRRIGEHYGVSKQYVHQAISNNGNGSLSGRDALREKVRIRDDHTCQNCGKKWMEGMRRFDAHHLDEHLEGSLGNIYKNNPLDRMITYCHKCHLQLWHQSHKH